MLKKPQSSADWTCPACTLINPVDTRVCSACDHELKKPKKLVSLIPGLNDRNSNSNNNSNNNNSNTKYSILRSTLNNLSTDVKGFILNSFNGNNNNINNSNNENDVSNEVIEIDPSTDRPVRQRRPRQISNNMWICKRCSYSSNPKWRSKCEMCLYEENSFNEVETDKNKNKNKEIVLVDDSTVYDTSLTEDIYDYARIWTCKFCTFINFGKDIQCELCLTPRLNNFKSSKSEINNNNPNQQTPDHWVCKLCTFLNKKTDTKCSLCKAANENKKNTSWSCEICSFKNDPNTKLCIVCSFDIDKSNNIINTNKNIFNDNKNITDDPSPTSSIATSDQSMEHNTSLFLPNSSLSQSLLAHRSRTAHKNYANATSRAERIWKNIVSYCKANQITFVDDSFPPCEKSLYINLANRPADTGKLKHASIQWLRPNFIRVNSADKSLKWTVYNEPKFSDIKQGLLGDCWLISAIAVLIEQPEMLKKIIMTKDYCQEGCYQVRLCHNGEWQTVIVDDLFPCDQNGALIYSQASRKQLWIPLIEKAIAKLNGSYESLIAGQTVEGLSILTGFPCDAIRLEKMNLCRSEEEEIDFDIIWAKLLSMKEAGYTMGASCGRIDNSDESFFTDRGLLSRHAYSILNIKEVNGHQLIQLRNPWGRYTWNGDWSETSSKWTPELRKILGLKKQPISAKNRQLTTALQSDNHFYNQNSRGNSDEGIFWMSFNDFSKYFGIIDVCKTRLDLYESRMSGYFNPEGTREMQAYHMVVFEASQIDIGLFHKTNKNRRENSDLDLSFVVLKASGNKDIVGKFVTCSNRAVRKFIGTEHIFTPGEYLIVPISLNFWYTKDSTRNSENNATTSTDNTTHNNLYNLVIHSTKEFFIEQEMHHAFLLADTVIQLCLKLGQPKKQDIRDATVYALSKNWCGLIVVVENASPNAYLHIEVECLKSMNVVSTRQTLCTVDSVPPCHRQVLIALSHLEGSNGYSINYNISYRASSNALLNTWPRLEGQKVTNSPAINKKTFGLHAPRSMFLFN